MKKLVQALSALALALGMAGTAQAVSLTDLLGGQSITVGDKLFANWSLIDYAASDLSRSLDPDNIDVVGLNDGGDYGLQFNISDGELTVTGDDIYAFVDLWFRFSVTVQDPDWQITDSYLELNNGSVSGAGDNGFAIVEKVGTSPGSDNLGLMEVQFSWLDPSLIEDLSATAVFAPQNSIWVDKNILVWATGADETAALQGFQQRFSQTPTNVPEPATALLFGLGLAGIGLARRRRV